MLLVLQMTLDRLRVLLNIILLFNI